MSQENVELLRQANQAFNRGDLEQFLAFCDENVEIEDLNNAPDLPRVTYGKADSRVALAAWTDAFENFSAEIQDYIDVDERYVGCLIHYRGTHRGTGMQVDYTGVDMWEVSKHKLVRGTLGYPDAQSALADVEQSR